MPASARSAAHWSLVLALVLSSEAQADKILDLYGGTLTSYKAGAATVQAVIPLPEQRGVFVDGTLAAPPTLNWALAADPFDQATWDGNATTLGKVRAQLGTYQITDVDIALPAPGFSWVVGRSYNARQVSGGSPLISAGPQGNNWFQASQPELVQYVDGSNHANDVVYLVYGADRYIEFHRTDASSTEYKAVNGAAGVLQFAEDTAGPDLWKYTDQHGTLTTFFGFDTGTAAAKRGQLWKIADPDGNTAYVGHLSNKNTALSNGFDSSGRIVAAYDSAGRKYVYNYASGHLDYVKVQEDSGGGYADTGQRVDYTYYGNGDSNGSNGDLKTAKVTTPTSGGAQNLISTSYYRYYTSGSYALKMVVGPEGTRAFDWIDASFDNDFLSASDDDLKPYAEAFFATYDSSRRITELWLNGECGCSGGINGTYDLSYESVQTSLDATYYNTIRSNTQYDQTWGTRTVVRAPLAHVSRDEEHYLLTTLYFDEVGQPLSKVQEDYRDDDVLIEGPWASEVVRDANGMIDTMRSPENITAYDDTITAVSFTSSDTVGLVRLVIRDTSGGDLNGFIKHYKFKTGNGSGNDKNLEHTIEYTTHTKTIGAVVVARPVISASWDYSSLTTSEAASHSGPTGAYETTYSYSWWTGAALMMKQATIALPKVATGHNGNNTNANRKQYFRKDGTLAFDQTPDGVYTYSQITNGLETKHIDDAKIDDATAFGAADDPNGTWGISETGAHGLHVVTEFSRDEQGRVETVKYRPGQSNEQREVRFHTFLKDRRPTELVCPRFDWNTSKYYGPLNYSVLNQAGMMTFDAVVAVSAAGVTDTPDTWVDSTTGGDPIASLTAFPGGITRLKTKIYDPAGLKVSEDRMYVTVPSSGDGSLGTNYERRQYAYDPRGRRDRLVDMKGTITRYRFDAKGHPIQKYLGTDDSDFDGLVPTDNMSLFGSYDSSGNSGTGFIAGSNPPGSIAGRNTETGDDGQEHSPGDWFFLHGVCVLLVEADDKTVEYTRDVRENIVLQVNAQTPPHILVKYDVMNRPIAVGYFSDVSDLVGDPFDASTFDPTTRTSGRMALVEYAYDERGRVWKTTRHKIDSADGSDDDSISAMCWFDDADRLIKVDGPELEKVQYDGLGRVTREFKLASDDDTTYANASDANLSGDVVLREHRWVYDIGTRNVLTEAVIDRRQDDYGGSQTTGWLDKNLDGDDYKFTGTDLKGRAQIRASWFDAWQRIVDTVSYGTYSLDEAGGPSYFNRSGLSVPSRTGTKLRTSYSYDETGALLETSDARDKKTRFAYDAAGRATTIIRNYVNGVAGGSPTATDDQFTWFVYGSSSVSPWTDEIRVDRDGDGTGGPGGAADSDDSVTQYIYGIRDNDSPLPSMFASNSLLRKAVYPDSTTGNPNEVILCYEGHQLPYQVLDQAQNTWTYTRDALTGREVQKTVSYPGSPTVDASLLGISTTYDSLGRVQSLLQDNRSNSGDPPDSEVDVTYDGWGNVSKIDQDPDVGMANNTYSVSFSYTVKKGTAGRETIRRSSVTATTQTNPVSLSRVISYTYSSTGGLLDDLASRITKVSQSSTVAAQYSYLGVNQVVGVDYPEPSVFRHDYGSTGTYPSLDIFNRVTKDIWTKDLATDRNFFEANVTYDENSNITLVDDLVFASVFDSQHTIDDRDRLTETMRGNWNGSTLSATTDDEQWTLTQAGNVDLHKLDINGNGSFTDYGSGDLQDKGTFNKANELTDRNTDNSGSNEYASHGYDALGDLTDDKEKYTCEYDALGRLRRVRNRSTSALVTEYRYNAMGWRIAAHSDVDADGTVEDTSDDPWYFFSYDDRWRLTATFRAGDAVSNPKEIFVHDCAGLDGMDSHSYADALALRVRDVTGGWNSASDGTLEERRYVCQNGKADVVAVLTDAGKQVEQVRYLAYGGPYALPAGDQGDGDWDSTDSSAITAGIGGAWNALLDVDLDGSITASDITSANAITGGYQTLGRGVLSSTAVGNRRGFGGQEWDQTIAKQFMRFRVFDPYRARWLTRDPAGYLTCGLNLYEFVNSDPLACVDPLGLYRDWIDRAIDFGAGVSDGLTFGLTYLIRDQTGLNDAITTSSNMYQGGMVTGMVGGMVATGGVAAGTNAGRAVVVAISVERGLTAEAEAALAARALAGPAYAYVGAGGAGALAGGSGLAMLPELLEDPVEEPVAEPLRGTNQPGQTTSRGQFWKGTVNNVWNNARVGPGGGRQCSTCTREYFSPPGRGPRPWDIDHQPPWRDRLFPADVTRADVIRNYQEGTSLRCPACNRSDNGN